MDSESATHQSGLSRALDALKTTAPTNIIPLVPFFDEIQAQYARLAKLVTDLGDRDRYNESDGAVQQAKSSLANLYVLHALAVRETPDLGVQKNRLSSPTQFAAFIAESFRAVSAVFIFAGRLRYRTVYDGGFRFENYSSSTGSTRKHEDHCIRLLFEATTNAAVVNSYIVGTPKGRHVLDSDTHEKW